MQQLLILLPTLLFCFYAGLKEFGHNQSQWLRYSTLMTKIRMEPGEYRVIVGNSYIYSGIDPKVLNQGEDRYLIFAVGSKFCPGLLNYLKDNLLLPKEVICDLSVRDLEGSYRLNLDAIFPKSQDPFDAFKSKVEVNSRLLAEKYLPFLSYNFSIINVFEQIKDGSVLNLFRMSLNSSQDDIGVSRKKYYQNGFVEDLEEYTPGEIEARSSAYFRSFMKESHGSKFHIESTITEIRKLVDWYAKNEVKVSFIRLPRSQEIVDYEDSNFADLFNGLEKMMIEKELDYLDLTKDQEIMKQSRKLLSDGAHWTSRGAHYISSILRSSL